MSLFRLLDRSGASRPAASTRRRRRATAVVVALALVAGVGVGVTGGPVDSAQAASYPSWADVEKARGDEAAKVAEIKRLEEILDEMTKDLDRKNADAKKKGDILQKAQTAFDEAQFKTQQLRDQADSAATVAAASEERAGQLAAQLGRSGGNGNDMTGTLIADPGDAGELLYKLGAMTKLTEQADGIYSQATQDRNTAQSLTDQAAVAEEALGELAAKAQAALEVANEAARAAADSLAEQQENGARLQAQLVSLKTNADTTQAQFEKGEAERKKKEAEAAARAARLGSPTSGTPVGVTSSFGWTRPSGGNVVSGFGMRVNPVTGAYILHAGTDLAAACNTPIFAATAGTVVYAGWYGGYGNYVLIDHGNGITTAYGHQPDGGIMVGVGQRVALGQQIGHVGSTGNSTGCHLHFETRINGTAANPVAFMAQRGITL
ncbi:peptidoglycan DD-metalloendopeptidase family protein [Frigoribacterium sp. CFBP9039]|uniref:peptidoglycan DD-metalloendopeptidase family protein n=1 Tax=Frigoribacterium sp. CFBP9029 TaxID=3096541 RepID=UPI002A6A2ECC|nr:peptidoglycan DD-metalloendopeptidase family protein [Frigoribacterium sp. CFBP9039]MDY0945872.1 peptidoglycan DD-metalloendopeptidase family protein [Frigoribacterium sp. CFBP9039]